MPPEFPRSRKLPKGALVVYSSPKPGPSVDGGIGDEAHIINIDSIVLTLVDLRNPGRPSALIEAEVARTVVQSPTARE